MEKQLKLYCFFPSTRLSVWSQSCCLTSHLWISALNLRNSLLLVLLYWDCRHLKLAGDLIGRQHLWEVKQSFFLCAHWLFFLSQYHNWALADGHWSDVAKHAGCRKRNAAEEQAGVTGSVASQLLELHDAFPDPHLLR